jgi:membrane protease subunit HflK
VAFPVARALAASACRSALIGAIAWGSTGIVVVQPDEQGVIMRFGEFVEQRPPGFHFHLPWPIETALTPKVTRVNRIDVGLRTSDGKPPSDRCVGYSRREPDAHRR